MNSAKNFKGIRPDFDEFESSDSAFLNQQYDRFRKRLVSLYHEINDVFSLTDKQLQYDTIIRAFQHVEQADKLFIQNTIQMSSANKQEQLDLSTLCLADSKTPFFAGAKLPSMNASRISISPRSYRSLASSYKISWKVPRSVHSWKRRWQVWYGGYLEGISFQGAPVRNIHNIPFITSRAGFGFRPRGSFWGVVFNIMGSIRFHCSFVSSILIILHIQNLMSSFF